jgi:hypothetical protein
VGNLEARMKELEKVQVSRTLVELVDVLLGADAADITFSSIAQAFRHLRIVGSLRSDRSAVGESVGIQINGDTGNNYYSHRAVHSYTSGWVTSEQIGASFISLGGVVGNTAPAGIWGNVDYALLDYTSLNIAKSMQSFAAYVTTLVSDGPRVEFAGGSWIKTPYAAVTSIKLYPAAGGTVWLAGSRVTLYGQG